jgi:hypothetical protein
MLALNYGDYIYLSVVLQNCGYSQSIRNFNIKDWPQYFVPALFFVSEDCWLQAALFI